MTLSSECLSSINKLLKIKEDEIENIIKLSKEKIEIPMDFIISTKDNIKKKLKEGKESFWQS